jgi:hypothetical protein
MSANTAAIQKLYVAYFNRPADFSGLAFWEGIVAKSNGDTAAVSAAFAASAEYKATFANMDDAHVVATIYQNLFGRAPELGGLTFWTQALMNKAVTIDNVVATIASAAGGDDLTTINNKVAAATAFSAALDTTAEALGYGGDAANAAAKAWLSSITTTDSLNKAITDAAINATVNSVIHPAIPGQTLSLTQGMDNLVGTANNDVFNAFAFNSISGADTTTLNSVDTIDGGAGNDTLNIEVKGGLVGMVAPFNGTLQGTVTNVETINIDNSGNNSTVSAVSGSMFAGATSINQIGKAANVTGLAASTVAGFKSVSLTTAAAEKVSAASTATNANIALTSVKGDIANNAAFLEVAGASLTGVTVSGTLAKNSGVAATASLNLTVDAGADAAGKSVSTVSVNTGVKTTLTVAETGTGNVTTVDASASTGAVKYMTAGSAVSTIKGGSGNDALSLNTVFSATATKASISGGAGNDTITIAVDTTGHTGTFTADAGDGNDIVNAAQGNLIAGNKIDGGAGTDTLVLTNSATFGAGDYVLLSSLVSNVETLDLTNAVTIDASKVAQFSTLEFDANSVVTEASKALVAHANLDASAAGYDAGDASVTPVVPPTYAGSLNITADGNGAIITANADTATVTVEAQQAASGGVSVTIGGDLKTSLTVNTVNSTDSATAPTADTLTEAFINVGAALKAVVLTGGGTVHINDSAAAAGTIKLATIDASALGGVSAAPTTAGEIVGGLDFTGNAAVAETITLGSGHDLVTVNSTYAKLDTIVNFDAVKETNDATSTTDVLTFNGVVLGDASATLAKVTLTAADSTLDLAFIKAAAVSHAAADAAVFFQFGGNTYVFQDAVSNGTLDNADLAVKLVGTFDLTKDFSAFVAVA